VVGSVQRRSRSQVFTQVCNAPAHLRLYNTYMNVLKSRYCERSVCYGLGV
jgi:hypothetical protein